jgi:uncharacterized membrane protein
MLLAPFLGLALLIGLFVLIQIQAIGSVFSILGLSPRAALFALLASLIGSGIPGGQSRRDKRDST